jgi:hypothetical protein
VPPAYIVPEGAPTDPPPQTYIYSTFALDGTLLRTANASEAFDAPFLAWDKSSGTVFAMASKLSDPDAGSVVISFDPETGETVQRSKAPYMGEEPFCVGAMGDGVWYFVNGLIVEEENEIIAYNTSKAVVDGRVKYERDGVISSVAAWEEASGKQVALALLWPADPTSNCSLVSVDPLSGAWSPTTLVELPAGLTPSQGLATVIGTTFYGILQHNEDDTDRLLSVDLSVTPPAYKIVTVDLSRAPFGLGGLGGVHNA